MASTFASRSPFPPTPPLSTHLPSFLTATLQTIRACALPSFTPCLTVSVSIVPISPSSSRHQACQPASSASQTECPSSRDHCRSCCRRQHRRSSPRHQLRNARESLELHAPGSATHRDAAHSRSPAAAAAAPIPLLPPPPPLLPNQTEIKRQSARCCSSRTHGPSLRRQPVHQVAFPQRSNVTLCLRYLSLVSFPLVTPDTPRALAAMSHHSRGDLWQAVCSLRAALDAEVLMQNLFSSMPPPSSSRRHFCDILLRQATGACGQISCCCCCLLER